MYVWQAFGGICDNPKYIEALDTVLEGARLARDDVLLRIVSQRREMSIKKKEAACTATAKELRRAAEADQAAMRKQREEQRELERRAALEETGAKRALAEAQGKAASERRKELEASRLDRFEQEEQRKKLARLAQDAQWLQAVYPKTLAERLLAWRKALPADAETAVRARIDFLVSFKRTSSTAACPYLWDEDRRFTSALGNVTGPDRARHAVRCSKTFEWLLFENKWASGLPYDATYMLLRLIERILPNGRALFATRYTAQVLLHDNQYVVEKAFVNAVFLMYRWLGPGWLPGQWEWPPEENNEKHVRKHVTYVCAVLCMIWSCCGDCARDHFLVRLCFWPDHLRMCLRPTYVCVLAFVVFCIAREFVHLCQTT